jgi:hypothetical protein
MSPESYDPVSLTTYEVVDDRDRPRYHSLEPTYHRKGGPTVARSYQGIIFSLLSSRHALFPYIMVKE